MGRQPIIIHCKMSSMVLNTQFRVTIQGDPSSQLSQPKAHFRHLNASELSYLFSLSFREREREE